MRSRGLACCALGIGLFVACGSPGDNTPGPDAAPPVTPAPDAIAIDAPPPFGQQAYLKAVNPGPSYGFGIAIAISADGSTLAVGARNEASASKGVAGEPNNSDAPGAGAVYVYTRDGAGWKPQAYLKASNTGAGDNFGGAIALSANGLVLAVGAEQESSLRATDPTSDAAPNAGAVYLFTREAGGSWQQKVFVKAANANANDRFGHSVALAADGGTLAVGAIGEASGASGVNGDPSDNSTPGAGAAYVYSFTGTLAQQAYAKAASPKAGDAFGSSVTLSADGMTLAVGSPLEDSGAIGVGGDPARTDSVDAGGVYVFTLVAGDWGQRAYVKASNTAPSAAFGSAVALSGDASTLAVGAKGEASAGVGVGGSQVGADAAASGAAYVFVSVGGSWMQQAYIKASNAAHDDAFGSSIALSSNGSALAVAAPAEDSSATGIDGSQSNDDAVNAGAVYLFARTDLWRQRAYVKASNTEAGDDLASVALSGDGATLAAGADGEASGKSAMPADNSMPAAGAAYVFH